jgi:WbqC-like protein family
MTLYSAHQPDLLPYTGFWYKMAKADVFDIKIWDQFVDKGYQRRVKMREQWVTLPLVKSSATSPINTKRVTEAAPKHLADEIVLRYTHAKKKPPHWDKFGPMICDEVLSIKTDLLWELNFRLILLVREILGIQTPLTFSRPAAPGLRGSAGIVSTIQAFHGPMEYLSGLGGRSYMGDCQEFKDAGIPVVWSRHHAVTGDSILSVLFDHEDPMSVVLAEGDHDSDGSTTDHDSQGAV